MIINILRANVMSIIEGLTVLIAQKSEGKVSFEQLWASDDERRKLDIYYREAISDLEGKLMKWLKGSHSQFNLLAASEGDYELEVQVSNWPEKLGGLLGNKVQDYLVHAVLAGWLNNFAGLEIKQDYAGMAAQDLDDIWTILSQREFRFGTSDRGDDSENSEENKEQQTASRQEDAARAKQGSISFDEREEDSFRGTDEEGHTDAGERKGDNEAKNLIAGRAYAGRRRADRESVKQNTDEAGERNGDAARAKHGDVTFDERQGDAARAKHGSISFDEREGDDVTDTGEKGADAGERKGDNEAKNLIAGRAYAGRRRADREAVKQNTDEAGERNGDAARAKQGSISFDERQEDAARAKQGSISFDERQGDDVTDTGEKGADADERKGDNEAKNLIAGRAYAGRRRADRESVKQNTDEAGERNGDAARAKQNSISFDEREEDSFRGTDEEGHTDAGERKGDREAKNLIAGRAEAGRRRADNIDTGRSAEADSGERKKDCVPIFHHRDTTDWSGEGIGELMQSPRHPQLKLRARNEEPQCLPERATPRNTRN